MIRPPCGVCRLHHADRVLGAEERAGEVHVDDRLPLRVGEVLHRDRRAALAGVVEEEVDPAQLLGDGGEEGVDGVGSPTSVGTARATLPGPAARTVSATSASGSGRRPASAKRRQPSSRRAVTAALPTPVPAPVMTATCSERSTAMGHPRTRRRPERHGVTPGRMVDRVDDDHLVDVVEAMVTRARERCRDQDVKMVETFLRHYFANVAPDDLEQRTPDDLYGAALSHWQLARRRAPGEANVRAFTPVAGEDGWQTPHSVIDIVSDDMPFILDSVMMAIEVGGRAVHLLVYPVLDVTRDGEGVLTSIAGAGDSAAAPAAESFIHLEFDRVADEGTLSGLAASIRDALRDVRATVSDWQPMRDRAAEVLDELDQPVPGVPDDDRNEARALLEYLLDDHFTFIAYREYSLHDEAISSVDGTGPRDPQGRAPEPARPPRPATRRCRAGLGAGGAEPHEDERHEHGPPSRPPRLHRHQALRRRRRGDRRAPLPRPVHVERLRRVGAGAPRRAAQGRADPRPPRQPGVDPRPRHPAVHPRDLPARRAVRRRRRRPRPDRAGHPAPAGAAQGEALRPPRHVRPLHLVPRVRPAGPLQHRGPGADPGPPPRRCSAGPTSPSTAR